MFNRALKAATAGVLLLAAASASAINVNSNWNGNWSDVNGRGIIVTILDNAAVPNGKSVLLQWFTNTEDGVTRYYVGAGAIENGVATFDVGYFEGGVFNSSFGGFAPGDVSVAGTVTAEFLSCNMIRVTTSGGFEEGDDAFLFSPLALSSNAECVVDEEFAGCPAGTTAGPLAGSCVWSGTYSGEQTMENHIIHVLDGQVFFGETSYDSNTDSEIQIVSSATLNIEANTKIVGAGDGSAMIISPGSQIFANGTASNPIVMTSPLDSGNPAPGQEPAPGNWGGLFIRGLGITNGCQGATPCVQADEALLLPYGGDNPLDSSGNLQYLMVMYAGFEFRPDEELNGITLAGVGSGTVMENIVVFQGSDDGIEYFGGNARINRLGLLANRDDYFDTCCGADPVIQHMVVIPDSEGGDHGWEADNVSGVPDEAPLTGVKLANASFIGNGTSSNGNRQRRGANAKVYNSVIFGWEGVCLDVNDNDTFADFQNGDLLYNYTGIGTCNGGAYGGPGDTEGVFLNQEGNFQGAGVNFSGFCPPAGAPHYNAGGPVGIDNALQTGYIGHCAHPDDNWLNWAGNLVEWTLNN